MNIEELKITNEDINLLKEMKENCLKASVYKDEKRLLKANAITKFLVEHQEKQELIEYLKEQIIKCDKDIKIHKKEIAEVVNISDDNRHLILIKTLTIEKEIYKKILSKIEKR